MKLKLSLAASLFALIAALNAGAATDTPADRALEKAAAPAAPAKKVKPHSHVEEKTGVAQKAPEAKADKPDASKDMSKHYHPRDGK